MEMELVKWMIRRDYKTKFYLDKLPAGYNLYPLKDKYNNPEIHYTSGIPIGYYVTNVDGSETFYIYNHLSFNVKVHYEKNLDKYTIVGFNVIPISINHQIDGYTNDNGILENKLNNDNEKNENRSLIKDLSQQNLSETAIIDNNSKDEGKRSRFLDEFLKKEDKIKIEENNIHKEKEKRSLFKK